MQNRFLRFSLFVCLTVSAIIKSGDDVWLSNGKASIVGKCSLLKCASTLYSASSKAYIALKGEDREDEGKGIINIHARANGSLLRQLPNRINSRARLKSFALTDDFLVSGVEAKNGLCVDAIVNGTTKRITLQSESETPITNICAIPQQPSLVSCTHDMKFRTVDIEKGSITYSFEAKSPHWIGAAIPDNTGNGFWLVQPIDTSLASNYTVTHYDTRTANYTVLPITARSCVPTFCVNQSNSRLAFADDGAVMIFDVVANKADHTILLPEGRSTECVFFSDDNTIVYNTQNKNLGEKQQHTLHAASLLATTRYHRSVCSLHQKISVLKHHPNTNLLVGTTEALGPGLIVYDFGAAK